MKRTPMRIAVAMSGGVDSSLAAALLKKKRYGLVGLTFRSWPKEECGSSVGRACCNLEAVTRARAVAEDLGIPYYVIDVSKEFKEEVIDYFCAEYLKGNTPNPCVVCNERIKFRLLAEKARALGATAIATGHYARITRDRASGRYLLREGKDAAHDQSYFLFSLSQEQLGHALFPLGEYTKAKVRSAARRMKVLTYDTASSQDICFVQDAHYADYIRKRTGVAIAKGEIVDRQGKVLGEHRGIPFYTIGQRRGLGIAYREPLYVTAIDVARNRIIVGTKRDVLHQSIIAGRVNWVAVAGIRAPITATVKIRYNHRKVKAVVTPLEGGAVRVDFAEPQEAPTPGQAAVFYNRDTVIGGGWITKAL